MKAAITILVVFLLWALAVRCAPKGKDFTYFSQFDYAHRGLHDLHAGIPENSMTAFYRAIQHGYGVELDVHMAKDGTLVVMHDENLKRMTGKNSRICDMTLQQLRQCRLQPSGQAIPQLQQVLSVFSGRTPLLIELKTCGSNSKRLTKAVCHLLDCYPDVKVCLESFDPRALIWLRRHRPDILRGQLASNFLKVRGIFQRPGAFLSSFLITNWLSHPNFISHQLRMRYNPGIWMCKFFWRGQIFTWTVHTPKDLALCRKRGAIVIFERLQP